MGCTFERTSWDWIVQNDVVLPKDLDLHRRQQIVPLANVFTDRELYTAPPSCCFLLQCFFEKKSLLFSGCSSHTFSLSLSPYAWVTWWKKLVEYSNQNAFLSLFRKSNVFIFPTEKHIEISDATIVHSYVSTIICVQFFILHQCSPGLFSSTYIISPTTIHSFWCSCLYMLDPTP